MNDSSKSKQAHTEELESLKRKIRELEQAEIRWKQVEEALNKTEETFRNLIEHAPDARLSKSWWWITEANSPLDFPFA